jgi:hypothetical protein
MLMPFVKRLVLGLLILLVHLVPLPAHAQDGFPEASPEVILWSVRACYAEATWSFADCSALLHVIRKRSTKYHWPFLKMLKQYSVVNWVHEANGRQTSRLKLVNKHKSEQWNRKWQELVSHVNAIFADTVSDPCPRADHWAATYYKPRSPMRRVKCTEKVANAFWVSIRG